MAFDFKLKERVCWPFFGFGSMFFYVLGITSVAYYFLSYDPAWYWYGCITMIIGLLFESFFYHRILNNNIAFMREKVKQFELEVENVREEIREYERQRPVESGLQSAQDGQDQSQDMQEQLQVLDNTGKEVPVSV